MDYYFDHLNFGDWCLFRISIFEFRICHPFIRRGCFMQNKPNFKKAKMNITSYKPNNYKENRLCARLKNKPKQTQFLPYEALAKEGQTHRRKPPVKLGAKEFGAIIGGDYFSSILSVCSCSVSFIGIGRKTVKVVPLLKLLSTSILPLMAQWNDRAV